MVVVRIPDRSRSRMGAKGLGVTAKISGRTIATTRTTRSMPDSATSAKAAVARKKPFHGRKGDDGPGQDPGPTLRHPPWHGGSTRHPY